MKIRIKFSKLGNMKFIGHLDMMRYFQKAIRRSGIDVAYTGGFSPHQIMSFAAPLGVGLTSIGEYMDIELDTGSKAVSSVQVQQLLNQVMTDGVEILSVKALPENAGNAMASVAAAQYAVTFRQGYEPKFDWQKQLIEFLDRPSIPVIKQTKKSEMELDLKPFIFEYVIQEDILFLTVDASSSGNIKPGLVIEAFYKDNGHVLGEFDLEIMRLETYGNAKNAEKTVLLPLADFGIDF